MSLAVVYSRANLGISAPLVTIEIHMSNGLPGLSIVGLPEASVKESKDRVRGAILNSHFEFPAKRIIINLAPADLPKSGGRYDLPIAIGILIASGQIDCDNINNYEILGELALSGDLRAIAGVIPVAIETESSGRTLLLPNENAAEASYVLDKKLLGASHLIDVCLHLSKQKALPFDSEAIKSETLNLESLHGEPLDMSDVKGQHHAKRALEIAAAGGHSVLLTGSPGTGKTMLASRLPGILPEMNHAEAVESAAVQSMSLSGFNARNWKQRVFRSPHHTASAVALVGGGSNPKPGEISLAHNGVLFLDELPEFNRHVLEVLREPMESGQITISRAAQQVDFPAKFQFIGAMNPCPCGYYGDENYACRCTEDQVKKYRSKISGPLLDRIDIQISVPRLKNMTDLLETTHSQESSQDIKQRVSSARKIQSDRSGIMNANLSVRQIDENCTLDQATQTFLHHAMIKLKFSNRAYHKLLKLSRTIADLAGDEKISSNHIAEAFTYRNTEQR